MSGWSPLSLDDADVTARLDSDSDLRITVVQTLTLNTFAEAYRVGPLMLMRESVDDGVEPMDMTVFSRWSPAGLFAHYGDVHVDRASNPYAS